MDLSSLQNFAFKAGLTTLVAGSGTLCLSQPVGTGFIVAGSVFLITSLAIKIFKIIQQAYQRLSFSEKPENRPEINVAPKNSTNATPVSLMKAAILPIKVNEMTTSPFDVSKFECLAMVQYSHSNLCGGIKNSPSQYLTDVFRGAPKRQPSTAGPTRASLSLSPHQKIFEIKNSSEEAAFLASESMEPLPFVKVKKELEHTIIIKKGKIVKGTLPDQNNLAVSGGAEYRKGEDGSIIVRGRIDLKALYDIHKICQEQKKAMLNKAWKPLKELIKRFVEVSKCLIPPDNALFLDRFVEQVSSEKEKVLDWLKVKYNDVKYSISCYNRIISSLQKSYLEGEQLHSLGQSNENDFHNFLLPTPALDFAKLSHMDFEDEKQFLHAVEKYRKEVEAALLKKAELEDAVKNVNQDNLFFHSLSRYTLRDLDSKSVNESLIALEAQISIYRRAIKLIQKLKIELQNWKKTFRKIGNVTPDLFV